MQRFTFAQGLLKDFIKFSIAKEVILFYLLKSGSLEVLVKNAGATSTILLM